MKKSALVFGCILLLSACAPSTPFPASGSNSSAASSPTIEQSASGENEPQSDFGIQGNYTVLTTATDGERPQFFRNFLEFPDCIIINSYMADGKWNVEQFEISSGKSICLIQSLAYSDKGELYGLDYARDKVGYDYCLLFEKGILYRSRTNREAESFESLPADILSSIRLPENGVTPYHFNGGDCVWAGSAGIMLTKAGEGKSVCILPNDKIDAVFANSNDPTAYDKTISSVAYCAPRFVNKGTGIIAQVREQQWDDLSAIVLYSMEDNAVSFTAEYGPPLDATIYPAVDRYICISNGTPEIIDTLNKTVIAPPLAYFYKTYDCKKFIQIETSSLDHNDDFKAFLCTADQLDDRSNLVLSSEGPTGIYITDVSEHYFTVTSENADDFWLALVSY